MKKLYLDDIRFPHESHGFDVVRNYTEFVTYIISNGIPDIISFDHDLAEHHYKLDSDQWKAYPDIVEKHPEDIDFNQFIETGYDIAKWLIEFCEENNKSLANCRIYVHSMNPVGSENIISLFNSYFKKKGYNHRVIKKSDLWYDEIKNV